MTFYWWSHWFWITLFYTLCVSIIFVSTYPSQDVSTETNQKARTSKTVTKLFQTTATLTWSTSISPEPERTILASISATEDIYDPNVNVALKVNEPDDDYTDQDETEPDALKETETITQEPNVEFSTGLKADGEFKRSAEVFKNVSKKIDPAAEQSKDDELNLLKADRIGINLKNGTTDEVNNYTNFSNQQQNSNLLTSQNFTTFSGYNANVTVQPLAATPSTPKITNIENSFDKINSITHLPLSQFPRQSTFPDITTNSGNNDYLQKAPFTLENVNKDAESEQRTRKPKVLSAEYKHFNRVINYSTDSKSLLTRSASTSGNVFDNDDDNNIASEALSVQRAYFLDASAISAICLTIFGVCCTVGTIGLLLYRRRYSNKPQTLSEPDSSVYIDDSTMRDNSDEMYSLDNDSFLNSLEAMTIQNYWTDTVKHTKL